MTQRMTDDERMEARDRARGKADDRAYDRLERRSKAAEALIGHLQGENGFRFYINIRSANGTMTGAIKEFQTEGGAIAYLIRNQYV